MMVVYELPNVPRNDYCEGCSIRDRHVDALKETITRLTAERDAGAKLLARQTDLAREAETRVLSVTRERVALQAKLEAIEKERDRQIAALTSILETSVTIAVWKMTVREFEKRVAALQAKLEAADSNCAEDVMDAIKFNDGKSPIWGVIGHRCSDKIPCVACALEASHADVRALAKVLLCHRTNHLCGTDTMVMGSRCLCAACIATERPTVRKIVEQT